MINRSHILGTNIIRKINNKTSALPRMSDSIPLDTSGSMNILFGIENLAQLLFSDRVLLVEGTTEQIILPSLFERLLSTKLEKQKIALIHAGGSGTVATMINILKNMNISYKAVVDLDFAFKVAPQRSFNFLPNTHLSFVPCKQILQRLSDNEELYLSEDNYPRAGKVKDGEKNITAARGFELLAEQSDSKEYINKIHDELIDKNIWVWKSGAIESCLCLMHKESGEWHSFRNKLITIENIHY